MAAEICLEGIDVRFAGADSVIRVERLVCPAGGCTAIVGPSGSGKTSLLRLMAGLDAPATGAVRIGDTLVSAGQAHALGVSMVMQGSPVYPHRTVADNLRASLAARRTVGVLGSLCSPSRSRRRHVETARIEERVLQVAELLGLQSCLDRRPGAISGGERQRVALGRALMTEPEVLLLDEPFSDLDPPLHDALKTLLHEVRRRRPMTVVLVTHDLDDAMSLADTVVVLGHGGVAHVGAPETLQRGSVSAEVAQFLGRHAGTE